jgi:hypothetical protein
MLQAKAAVAVSKAAADTTKIVGFIVLILCSVWKIVRRGCFVTPGVDGW